MRHITRPIRLTAIVAIATGVIAALPGAASAAPPMPLPRTGTLDSTQLLLTKVRYHLGDPAITVPMRTLLSEADEALTAGPWTIAAKTELPPSGDPHDYLSEAPYWWPTQPKTADNPWGCPYIQRDGVRNPAVDDIPDHDIRGTAFDAIYKLSLAWYYTGNRVYAERARLDLRTWFLEPATRMNPNMNFTQFIPCVVDGRGTGIIEFSDALPDVIDAVAILDSGAPSWTAADRAGMTSWFTDF